MGKAPRGYLSSTNAYLLVYSKVKTQLLQEVLKPPCNLVGMVKRENETLMSEVDHLVRESKSAQVIEETKQKEVAEIFTNLSVKPGQFWFHLYLICYKRNCAYIYVLVGCYLFVHRFKVFSLAEYKVTF